MPLLPCEHIAQTHNCANMDVSFIFHAMCTSGSSLSLGTQHINHVDPVEVSKENWITPHHS